MEKTQDIPENLKEMFEAGAHYAFSKARRHPSAKPFILGVKNKIEVFDLEKTVSSLDIVKNFIEGVVAEKGKILFAGGKVEAKEIIKNAALEIGMPYVAGRWIGGTMTNFSEIKKRVARMEELEKQKEKGELSKYTKKERLLIDREIEKLREMFSGLRNLNSLPEALFVVDSRKEHIAVKEAKMKKIPVVSLSGSDCDISVIDYPISANDASVSSIKYFVDQIVKSIKEGKKKQDTSPVKNKTSDTTK